MTDAFTRLQVPLTLGGVTTPENHLQRLESEMPPDKIESLARAISITGMQRLSLHYADHALVHLVRCRFIAETTARNAMLPL